MKNLRKDHATPEERALLDELLTFRKGCAPTDRWILDEKGCILVLLNWRNRDLPYAKAQYGCFGFWDREDTFRWVAVELQKERRDAEQERQALTDQLTGAYI